MKNIAVPSGVHVESGGESLKSTSGSSLLLQAASVSGLAKGVSRGLVPWRKPLAVHDPAKMVLDLAVAIAVGGDCLADVALLRAQPEIFGSVASDPTISRLLDTLAADADQTIAAIRRARATARSSVWERQSPLADESQVIIDLDATLIGSHKIERSSVFDISGAIGRGLSVSSLHVCSSFSSLPYVAAKSSMSPLMGCSIDPSRGTRSRLMRRERVGGHWIPGACGCQYE